MKCRQCQTDFDPTHHAVKYCDACRVIRKGGVESPKGSGYFVADASDDTSHCKGCGREFKLNGNVFTCCADCRLKVVAAGMSAELSMPLQDVLEGAEPNIPKSRHDPTPVVGFVESVESSDEPLHISDPIDTSTLGGEGPVGIFDSKKTGLPQIAPSLGQVCPNHSQVSPREMTFQQLYDRLHELGDAAPRSAENKELRRRLYRWNKNRLFKAGAFLPSKQWRAG